MSASTIHGVSIGNKQVADNNTIGNAVWKILKVCGSLKITVVMFFLAVLLVLFGTLAQDEQNLEEVKELYFNSVVAVVPFDVFLPKTVFPHEKPLPFGFIFPGGALIGAILMLNLIAAKLTRFSVQGKGLRLALGVLISLFGACVVIAVILAGNAADGLQGKPPVSYEMLWSMLKGGIYLLTIVSVVAPFVLSKRSTPTLVRIALWSVSGILVLLSAFLFFSGDGVRLDDPGLRIVWQLVQSSVAALIVLVGLQMVFGNRGGNVLIHVGVALMMLGQFIFGDRQVEQRMSLAEGQQSNMVFSQGEVELALIDTSDAKDDKVTAVPEAMLKRAASDRKPIVAPELPCKIKVLKWMSNSNLVKESVDGPKATAGLGTIWNAKEERTNGGATSKTNIASAYVELLDKKTDASLGIFLVTQMFNDQKQLFVGAPGDQYDSLTIDGKPYTIGLRFRREYKSYQVFLEDVVKKDYEASDRARDYSSHVVIRDDDGSELKGRIWMNNPLRYRGETFYQSEYQPVRMNGQTIEMTGLQVVANAGWIIPYVSCMLVFYGMLAHFGGTFFRFANRFERGAIPTAQSLNSKRSTSTVRLAIYALGTAIVLTTIYFYAAMPPKTKTSEMDWYAAGKIPAMHEGRLKPLDTVARNILQQIYEPLFGASPQPKDGGVRRSGTAWLLALMADKDWPADAPIFRIYSDSARDYFDLELAPSYLYSYNDLKDKADTLRTELASKDPQSLTKEQKDLAKVLQKMQLYDSVAFSYRLPPLPDESQFTDSEEDRRRFGSMLMNLMEYERQLEASNPPAVIPPEAPVEGQTEANKWQAFSPAIFTNYITQKLGMRSNGPNPALLKFTEVLDAVRENDSKKLNRAVADYREHVMGLPEAASIQRVEAEAWLNHFSPTTWGVVFYILAALVGLVGMIWMSPTTRWMTFTIIAVTFIVHTIAILSRIYVSGRPPVVNLYSSAVFIGWGSVLFAMILELIFPIGICNLVAAIMGACTLSIARSLDISDTMHVLEAVLDTQFWLSTHVITVTLGYAATFFAGALGIVTLIHRMVTAIDHKPMDAKVAESVVVQQILSRIIYAVLCFAILLSFIGTVLGGLWADDSWGRFWGWDPKENGALMIVLWNALVLHANWDRMVGPRGLAILAIFGNIVTSWSWFGTNQLGIGLHSYGFTEAVLATLAVVVVGHVGFAIVSLILTKRTLPPVSNIPS